LHDSLLAQASTPWDGTGVEASLLTLLHLALEEQVEVNDEDEDEDVLWPRVAWTLQGSTLSLTTSIAACGGTRAADETTAERTSESFCISLMLPSCASKWIVNLGTLKSSLSFAWRVS